MNPLIDQVLEPLADDEKSRAHTVWERRFGQPPASLKERARQYRFLLGRGFSAGVVASVVPRVSSPASAGAGEDGADGDIDDFFRSRRMPRIWDFCGPAVLSRGTCGGKWQTGRW